MRRTRAPQCGERRISAQLNRDPSASLPAPPCGVGDFAPLAPAWRQTGGTSQGKLCRLTCVERGAAVVTKQRAAPGTPTVVKDGARVTLGAEEKT